MNATCMSQQPRRLKRVEAWEMMRDISGNKYFYNHDDKSSQWDSPEIFGKVASVVSYKGEAGRSTEDLEQEAEEELEAAEEERIRKLPKPKRKMEQKRNPGHALRQAEIILVSHGKTAYGGSSIEGQHKATPLRKLAKQQAHYFGKRLRNACASKAEAIDGYYASDLERASETAALIFNAQTPATQKRIKEVIQDPRLRERDYGNLEGMSLPQSRDAQQTCGESEEDFSARIVQRCQELAQKHQGERILLVTHPGVLKAIWQHSQRLPPRAKKVFSVGPYVVNLKGMQNLPGARLVVDTGYEELEVFERPENNDPLPSYVHSDRTRLLLEFRGQPEQQERILERFPPEIPPHRLPVLYSAVPCKRITAREFLLHGVPSESATVIGFQHLKSSSGVEALAQVQRAWQ
jgi:probable phosphoglycerate mutase